MASNCGHALYVWTRCHVLSVTNVLASVENAGSSSNIIQFRVLFGSLHYITCKAFVLVKVCICQYVCHLTEAREQLQATELKLWHGRI